MRKTAAIIIALAASVCTYGRDTLTVDSTHSLADAIAQAREIHARESGTVTIKVEPGTYHISRPLHFVAEDSHLQIIGAGMGKSVIMGTLEAPAWRVGKDGIWVTDLSAMMPAGGSVPQLYVGGKRATLARTPNGLGTFPTSEIEENIIDSTGVSVEKKSGLAVDRLHLDAQAFEALANVDPITASGRLRVNYLHAWDITRRYIWSFDAASRSLYHVGGKQKGWNHTSRSSQMFFDNDKSFLDAPGEFFFDQDRALLYYIPLEGQDPERDKAQIPCARRIFHIKGTEDRRVSDISFEGLTLGGTRYDSPFCGNEPLQADAPTDAAVMAQFADGISFRDCEITLTGNNGIWLRTSCRDCSVEHCYLHDLGIGGVKIGDLVIPKDEDALLTRRIRIDNCIITGGSRELPPGVGVCLFQASDCTITHNEVSDFYYSGMSIGWRWGYSHSPSKRNIVEYNHIHHIGWGLLSDMGGVYTLGKSEGTSVSHNCIHDIYSYDYGGWGLYTDEGSTGIRLEYNLVYNCKSSGFNQHYGRDNIIANNIFRNGLKAQLEASYREDQSFVFERNIVCFEDGPLFCSNWEKVDSKCSHNIYWAGGEKALFNGRTLAEWTAATGKDASSIVTDPDKNKRALKKIGFISFDPSEAGVYGSQEWRSLAELPAERISLYEETVARYISGTK